MCKSVEGNCTLRHCVTLGTRMHNICDLHCAHIVPARQQPCFFKCPSWAPCEVAEISGASTFMDPMAPFAWHERYLQKKCMHITGVFCLSSTPCKDALPTAVFHAAILSLRVTIFVLLHKILIPAKTVDTRMHYTHFRAVFYAIQRCTADMLNLRVKVYVRLHKTLIRAEKSHITNTCFLPVFSAI